MPAPLIAAGIATGAAGSVANYMGGRSEAKRKQRALDAYNRRSSELYESMARTAWDRGLQRQKSTGTVLQGLSEAMGTPATAAPQTADFLPASGPDSTGLRGAEFEGVKAAALAPMQAVDQANLAANQAGIDRDTLAAILSQLNYGAQVPGMVKGAEYTRKDFLDQQALEEARRQLEAVLGSTGNKARNLQLLGSLLGTAGQGMMMGAAFSGGPAAAGGGAATYGGGGMPGPVSPAVAAAAPTSVYGW